MPGLVILHMAMILVVGAMTNPPAVVGHKDGWVCDIPNQIIQGLVVGEASMPTALNCKMSVPTSAKAANQQSGSKERRVSMQAQKL